MKNVKSYILPLALLTATSACQNLEVGYDQPSNPTTYVKELAIAGSATDSVMAYVYKDGTLESLRLMNLANQNAPVVIEEVDGSEISRLAVATLNGKTAINYTTSAGVRFATIATDGSIAVKTICANGISGDVTVFADNSVIAFCENTHGDYGQDATWYLERTNSNSYSNGKTSPILLTRKTGVTDGASDSLFVSAQFANSFMIQAEYNLSLTSGSDVWFGGAEVPVAVYMDTQIKKVAAKNATGGLNMYEGKTLVRTYENVIRDGICQRIKYDNAGNLMVLSVSKNRLVFQREIEGQMVTTILGVLGHGYDVKSCSLSRLENGEGIRVGVTSGTITGYLEFKESDCNEKGCKPSRAEVLDLNEL